MEASVLEMYMNCQRTYKFWILEIKLTVRDIHVPE